MKHWMFFFVFLFCFSCVPTTRKTSSSKNLCFDQSASIGKIVQISKSQISNCQLYDYVRIYPVQNGSCKFWEKSYGKVHYVHFNKIFLEKVNQFICFKQQYLNIRETLSKEL